MNQTTVKINDFLYYIGVNDRETKLFENQWPLPKGVTYNSYLINAEKTALLDTVKIIKVDDFVRNLEEALDGRDLDYLVIHHMEPDHSGSIEFIRKLYPNVKLVGNKKTLEFLEGFYDIKDEHTIVVAEGDELDLGDRKLTFFMTPMVHWPESMVSIDLESGILFSQDIFGGFGALDGPIFDDEIEWQNYADETARYYTNIVGKFSQQAQSALKKLEGVNISMICPVHGPVWRSNPKRILELYKRLATWQVQEGVVIAYGSMYGNTASMAEAIARELAVQGIKNVQIFDVSKTHPSYILNEAWKYRGLIIGSCTYNNGLFQPMRHLVTILGDNKMRNHTLGVFGSYSWSGGALKELQTWAGGLKNYTVLDATVETKSSPTHEDFEKCRELARQMADKLKATRAEDMVGMLNV